MEIMCVQTSGMKSVAKMGLWFHTMTTDIMQAGLTNDTSGDGYNPFMNWQTSDWLELDASVC